jgi:hypothetical protein
MIFGIMENCIFYRTRSGSFQPRRQIAIAVAPDGSQVDIINLPLRPSVLVAAVGGQLVQIAQVGSLSRLVRQDVAGGGFRRRQAARKERPGGGAESPPGLIHTLSGETPSSSRPDVEDFEPGRYHIRLADKIPQR